MDCNKSTQKVTVHFSFGGHLGFQNGRHFQHIWPIFQLLSSSGAHNGGNTYAYDVKGCNKSTRKVTGCYFLGGELKF